MIVVECRGYGRVFQRNPINVEIYEGTLEAVCEAMITFAAGYTTASFHTLAGGVL